MQNCFFFRCTIFFLLTLEVQESPKWSDLMPAYLAFRLRRFLSLFFSFHSLMVLFLDMCRNVFPWHVYTTFGT